MTNATTAATQQKAARIAGFMYLFTSATAIWASMIRSGLIVNENSTVTAERIMANEGLFRLAIALEMLTFASVVILPVALYIVFKPTYKNLALLGLVWRLAEAACMFAITFNLLVVLQLLNGADYFTAFDSGQLNDLAMLFIGLYKTGYKFALILLFFGSVVFNYLFLVSKYIPRFLAIWALAGSVILLIMTFAFALFPEYRSVLNKAYYIGLYEIVLGFWLLIKGVNLQGKLQ